MSSIRSARYYPCVVSSPDLPPGVIVIRWDDGFMLMVAQGPEILDDRPAFEAYADDARARWHVWAPKRAQ